MYNFRRVFILIFFQKHICISIDLLGAIDYTLLILFYAFFEVEQCDFE